MKNIFKWMTCLLCVPSWAIAFEHTKVLPKGVRSFKIKNVSTTFSQKSDAHGHLEALAQPLEKDLTFNNVLKNETGLKKVGLEAFLLREDFALDSSLGTFSADMRGSVRVTAPILTYGITERLTLAIATPYYQAKMGTELGFHTNAQAQRSIDTLHSPEYNQTTAAREAADKLNDAVEQLNKKLHDNSTRELTSWQGAGFGDTTIGAKYQAFDAETFTVSTTGGFVLPTGKTIDPNVLNGIPFGKGSLDMFALVGVDEYLSSRELFLNEYMKYTYSNKAKRQVRLATDAESIEVDRKEARYKLGDLLEGGLSLQYEPAYGLLAGLGVMATRKFGDRYYLSEHLDAKSKLQGRTDATARFAEVVLGYSSVPAFKRGEVPAPFQATVEYKKHLASTHTVVGDQISIDLAMFF